MAGRTLLAVQGKHVSQGDMVPKRPGYRGERREIVGIWWIANANIIRKKDDASPVLFYTPENYCHICHMYLRFCFYTARPTICHRFLWFLCHNCAPCLLHKQTWLRSVIHIPFLVFIVFKYPVILRLSLCDFTSFVIPGKPGTPQCWRNGERLQGQTLPQREPMHALIETPHQCRKGSR